MRQSSFPSLSSTVSVLHKSEKGNKRRAQQMLDKRLKELSQQYIAPLDDKSQLFLNFMRD